MIQILSSLRFFTNLQLWFFTNSQPCIIAAVLLMIVAVSLGFGLFSILTISSVLILSTVFLTLSRPKPVLVEESVKRSEQKEDLPQVTEGLSNSQRQSEGESVVQKQDAQEGQQVHAKQPKSDSAVQKKGSIGEEVLPKGREALTQMKYASHGAEEGQVNGYVVRSSDSLSESESQERSSTSEDSETSWPFRDNTEFSDGSISDEESLIEIAIPSGHFLGPFKGDVEAEVVPSAARSINYERHLEDLPGTIFEEHGLLEYLSEINEMNEEENLIEIDISIGSIKCSRFEIEA